MVDLEGVYAIVVAKEVVLSLFAAILRAGEAEAAKNGQNHESKENEEQCKVPEHQEIALVRILCLLARCIGVPRKDLLLLIVVRPRFDRGQIHFAGLESFAILVNQFIQRFSPLLIVIEIVARL